MTNSDNNQQQLSIASTELEFMRLESSCPDTISTSSSGSSISSDSSSISSGSSYAIRNTRGRSIRERSGSTIPRTSSCNTVSSGSSPTRSPTRSKSTRTTYSCDGYSSFPPNCFEMVKSLPGNQFCMDCGVSNPDWASVSYGILICLQCCGKHRSYGVKTSFVRSLTMDEWSHSQVLSMLEGGNQQLENFFRRHKLIDVSSSTTTTTAHSSSIFSKRYQTKAAQFYRTNLSKHVQDVSESGVYRGREASRKNMKQQQQQQQQQQNQQQHRNEQNTKYQENNMIHEDNHLEGVSDADAESVRHRYSKIAGQ